MAKSRRGGYAVKVHGLLLVALSCSAARSQDLSARVDNEYVRPVLAAVADAVNGRESSWTPPTLPGSARGRALSEALSARWVEPLLLGAEAYVFRAARVLASPDDFSLPEAPSFVAPGAQSRTPRFATGAPKFAAPADFTYAASRRVADSTSLVRGARVSLRPRLK